MYEVLFRHTQINHETFPLKRIGIKGIVCRFCKSSDTSFSNSSHAIPEFLGNKSIFTLDECDRCNSFFGNQLERHLSYFVPPSWFTRLKGKKGYGEYSLKGNYKISSDQIFFNITAPTRIESSQLALLSQGREYSNVKVYKAWVKMLVSLIPKEYLQDFSDTTKWLLSGGGFEFLNHLPYVVIGHQIPDIRLTNVVEVEVIRQIVDEKPIYQFSARFNNLYVKLPFSPKADCIFKGKILGAGGILNYEDIYFEEIDLSNYSSRKNYRLSINL